MDSLETIQCFFSLAFLDFLRTCVSNRRNKVRYRRGALCDLLSAHYRPALGEERLKIDGSTLWGNRGIDDKGVFRLTFPRHLGEPLNTRSIQIGGNCPVTFDYF